MPNTEHFDIVVMVDEIISSTARQWFETLYQPIIGLEGVSIYNQLQNLAKNNELESKKINFDDFINRLGLKDNEDFLNIKDHLEAVGLLDSYQKDNLVIFLLKPPLKPTLFFDNILLSNLLQNKIGKNEFNNLKIQFLVRRYDLNSFKKISKHFDDVYEIDYYDYDNEYDKWWHTIKKNYPKLSKNHFDYDTLISIIEPTDLIDQKILHGSDFFYFINSISFQYGLTVEELVQAIRQSANIQRTFDKELFLKAVSRIYDDKLNGKKMVIKAPLRKDENNELVKMLDSMSHNDLVTNKFQKKLLSSEITMFQTLKEKHGFSNGFINVLIIYVLTNKNGAIPSLNYFLKVANDWYRQGIKTTKDALDHIENEDKVVKSQKPQRTYKKTTKEPEWLQKHLEQTKEQIQKNENSQETLQDLEEFFNNLD